MRKIGFALLTMTFIACNNSATTQVQIDSLKSKVESKVENFADSAQSKVENVIDGAGEKLDSLRADSTNN